jgi:hypothetical protein
MFLAEKAMSCWHYKNAVLRKCVREIGEKPQNTVEDRLGYRPSPLAPRDYDQLSVNMSKYNLSAPPPTPCTPHSSLAPYVDQLDHWLLR